MSDKNTIETIMEDLLKLEQDSSSAEEEMVDTETQAKRNWVLFMRNQFCIRPEFPCTNTMLKPNGRLNQEYFQPRMEETLKEERLWTDAETNLLIQGIEKYGIGNWDDISKELPTKWTSGELRLRCTRLIGRQNLQLYKNWKGNADAISREFENNKRIGVKYNSWKQSVLVYDDHGEVEKELIKDQKQIV